MTRFPFAPLAELIEAQWRAPDANPVNGGLQHVSIVGKAAAVLDVDRASVHQWINRGLSPKIADRVAVRLGYHPGLVWPEWFDIEIPDTDLFAGACGLGTWGAIRRHQRNGESFCGPCRRFKAEYEAEWRDRNPDLERRRVGRANAVRPDQHRNRKRNEGYAA